MAGGQRAGAAAETSGRPAILVLEDGTTFHGTGFGADGETFGEMVFNTGMTGLETALRAVQEAMVETGLLDWAGVADRMSARPAAIGRLSGHGQPLAPGSAASLTLYDPEPREAVDPASHASRSRNTPFAGRVLPGRVVATFLRGRPTVLDGKLV